MSFDWLAPRPLGHTTARNALWLAPLTNQQSEADGTLSAIEERWLLRRAEGGFGVVETCAAHVSQDGKAWPGQMGIDRDALVPRLRSLATGLRERGALGIVQLFHGGARANPTVSGAMPWTASPIAVAGGGLEVSRAATEDDLARVVDDFRRAAERAHAAGFDGVELHGAHSYLLCQFLSSTLNQRTDRWGGSLENRARLLRQCVQAARSIPAPFLVGVRLSPEDYGNVTGLDVDEHAQIAKWLVEDGADFVHLSLWDYQQRSKKHPERGPFDVVRDALADRVPLVAAGKFWTPAEVDAWHAHNGGFIALGRAGICNPEWPLQAATPGWEPRRPPLTAAELAERDVGPPLIEYLRRWKGFVAD